MGWLDRLRARSTPPEPGRGTDAASGAPSGPDTPAVDEVAEVAARPGPPELRAVEVARAPLPFGEELVTVRGDTTTHLLDEVDAELLRGAWPSRPLAVHARALAGRVAVPLAEVEARLGRLAERGLLVDRAALRAAVIAQAGPPAGPAEIRTIGVVTKDRTALLERVVRGHQAVAARAGQSLEVAVYDDTPDAAQRGQHRAWAAAHGVRYAGLEEKRRYLERLGARVPEVPAEVLAYGLGLGDAPGPGTRVGANHNVGLLDAAGACVLSVDDDTTCRVVPTRQDDTLCLTGVHDPTDFTFYGAQDVALAEAPLVEADLRALHATLLGRSLGALTAAHTTLDHDSASAALLRRAGSATLDVRVTSLGLVGDSGMGSPSYYLLLPEPSRRALYADYTRHRTTRAVLRAVARPTLSTGTFLMGPSLGLDARELLPPLLPYGRNQDGTLAVTLRALLPDVLIGHVPAAVEHAPAEARRFADDAGWRGLGGTILADVLMNLIEAAPLGLLPSGAPRFEALGRHLEGLASLPWRELWEMLVLDRAARLASHAGRLQAALDAPPPGAPAAWSEDVARAVEQLRTAGVDPAGALPAGWHAELGAELAVARVALHVRSFGQLVGAWPRVFAAARALAGEGSRPATVPTT